MNACPVEEEVDGVALPVDGRVEDLRQSRAEEVEHAAAHVAPRDGERRRVGACRGAARPLRGPRGVADLTLDLIDDVGGLHLQFLRFDDDSE